MNVNAVFYCVLALSYDGGYGVTIGFLGVKAQHKKDEFCKKETFNNYLFCCFYTPFRYLKDGVLEEGKAGDILINTPGEVVYHGPLENSESGFINDWAHIGGEELGQLLNKYPLPLNEAFSVEDPELIHKYFRRLFAEKYPHKVGSEDMLTSMVTQMLIQMRRAYINTRTSDDLYNNKIAEIRREIVENPQYKWDLTEMALRSGYSVSRFCELFTKQYGYPPISFVISERVLLAKKYLLSGQMSVATVAETCGFSSINYFSRIFKKFTGFSPSEFVKL